LRAGWPWNVTISFGLVAGIYGRTGQLLQSLEPKHYGGLYGPELHRLHGNLLLAGSPPATDEAEMHLRKATALARKSQMEVARVRTARALRDWLG
jgi:hypothetical protein